MPTEKELQEFIYDERVTFRLPARHKKLLEQEARKRYSTSGDVIRELVREWVNRKTGSGAGGTRVL